MNTDLQTQEWAELNFSDPCKSVLSVVEFWFFASQRDDKIGAMIGQCLKLQERRRRYETLAAVSKSPSRSAAHMRSAYLLRISLLASRKSTSSRSEEHTSELQSR